MENMEKSSEELLDKKCEEIVSGCPLNLTEDAKMRYLYLSLGKVLSKQVEFFYTNDIEKQKEIYQNYETITNFEVICKSAVFRYATVAKKLGLDCAPIEMEKVDGMPVSHWALVYHKENDKQYLLNPIPDFYRVQLGFSTKHFCQTANPMAYHGPPFDTMTDSYLRQLDNMLGYSKSGMYTEELLDRLSSEMATKLGAHIIQSSKTYQDYYQKMLGLMKEKEASFDEKLEQIKNIDSDYEKNEKVIKECLKEGNMTKRMKKVIHTQAVKSLLGKDSNLETTGIGSKYQGEMDITKLKELKSDILIYKFNYMLECIPQLTSELTGFMENKSFMDEAKKVFFHKGEERSCLYRHTVVREEDGKEEYYMMFYLKPKEESEERIYAFYNHKTKECQRGIEPIGFMLEHHLKPLSNSSLERELFDQMVVSPLKSDPIVSDLKGKKAM